MAVSELEYLKHHWFELMSSFHIHKATSEKFWLEIVQYYSEKHRTYHNLHHLFDLFTKLEKHQDKISDLRAVQLAIWYHDIIYNPMSKRNEEKSAILCTERLNELKIDKNLIDKVHGLISSTKTHDVEAGENEAAKKDNEYLLDLDLSILGSDEKTYQQYTEQVRREYKSVPSFLYTPGRKKILKHFLEKRQIFKTEVFYENLEVAARANIRKELSTS